MATLVDGNGTIFMVNDNNGQVVEAIATNSDGSSYTTQWDTQTETNWVSRTEWNTLRANTDETSTPRKFTLEGDR